MKKIIALLLLLSVLTSIKADTTNDEMVSVIGETDTLGDVVANGASQDFIWTQFYYVPTVSWLQLSGVPSFSTVATSGSYNDLSDKPVILAYSTQPLATNVATAGGSWFTNNMSNELFVHVRYPIVLAAIAGNVGVQAWTKPSYTSTIIVTNDAKTYPSLLALLSSTTINDSMILEVPPHWVYCPYTNTVLTGLGNTTPSGAIANVTLLP